LIVAELAVNQVLRGELPRPAAYPDKLRTSAATRWRDTAHLTLAYAEANHAPAGRLTETAGAVATAAVQMGHSVLAARGEWVTNEKRLLERAGFREADRIIGALSTSPGSAERAVKEARELFDRVG
jgi:hypothetical protein